jgi:hypothetical protein
MEKIKCIDRIKIQGEIAWWDRMIFRGTIQCLSYQKGLEKYLNSNGIMLKNFLTWAKRLSDKMINGAKMIADINKVPYIFLTSYKINKDDLIKEIISQQKITTGMVAVIGTQEVDNSFDVYRNKETKKLNLVSRQRRSIHFYFYFISPITGLSFFRVQGFLPFKVSVYMNGREILAKGLDRDKIKYSKDRNCINWVENFEEVEKVKKSITIEYLHEIMDEWSKQFVNIIPELNKQWDIKYKWVIQQVEYASDLIFEGQEYLEKNYEELIEYLGHSTTPKDVLKFLGIKMVGRLGGKISIDKKVTYLGTRIKYYWVPNILKMYNKAGNVLRIEVTYNDVRRIKMKRLVRCKDGQNRKKKTSLKRSIYSLNHLEKHVLAVHKRFIKYLSEARSSQLGKEILTNMAESKKINNRNYKGFNILKEKEISIIETMLCGDFLIHGLTNKAVKKEIQAKYPTEEYTTARISRILKRCVVFKLIKRIPHSHTYHLTNLGRTFFFAALKYKNMVLLPELNKQKMAA